MNFSEIENLSQEDILELYDAEYLSGCCCYSSSTANSTYWRMMIKNCQIYRGSNAWGGCVLYPVTNGRLGSQIGYTDIEASASSTASCSKVCTNRLSYQYGKWCD